LGLRDFYNEFYSRAEKSQAHAQFCELVYGKNLCQHGMADMKQLEAMIKLLDINDQDRVLDVGCGNGYITELIAANTGARVTGIDLSEQAIAGAQRRVAGNDRVRFEPGDFRRLDFPAATFSKIVSIDTHYFVDDFEGFLQELLRVLLPKGKIGIFSDEGRGITGWDDSQISAAQTVIGGVLAQLRLQYTALNLSAANRHHWQLKAQVLKEFEAEFAQEDNLFLYKNRLGECTSSDRNLDCRFLFVIEKE
jgi:ubiquinone/menaquinone biosynthesis C-methylase UbiE